MNKTSRSSSCVCSPGPQMGKQFWETGTFETWASFGTRGLWRCHVSALVLAFLPTAPMGQPHAPSDMSSAIPTAMWSLSSWTEKLWNYDTKKNKQQQQEKPFPLTLLLPEILSQWRGDCFIHCSHPPRLEPWCSRRCLSTALTMVTKSEYEKTGLTHTLHRLDIFCPSFVRHVKFKVSPTCWWYFKPLLLLEGSIGIYMPQIPTKKLQFLSSDDHKSLNQYI